MTRQSYDVAGKVVLITGGTGGIGSATARELLRRGAKVAIVDVDPDTPSIAAHMSPHSAFGAVADVRVRSTLDHAVAGVVEHFGRIDVAIANAGILSRAATLRTTPASSLESVLAVNVTGVVNTIQAAMDQVVTHHGQFVLISSVFAFLNGMGTIPYAMSKAAVEQLGRGLRIELAAYGVSTTVAYFSLINTDMIRHGVDGDQIVDELLAALPRPLLKRLQPETAATALADGLSRRSPRVMAPGRWIPSRCCVDSSPRPWIRAWSATVARRPHWPNSTPEHTPHPDRTHERHDMTTWKDTPNRTIEVDGVPFAYRELGTGSDVPVVFLHHLTAVLDDWDPRVVDGIAGHHRVIAFDNRGVGGSGGSVPPTVEQMGTDAIAFIRALGLDKVDLFGFSLGGGVAQMVALQAPDLVRRMILAGTGPRGGGGIDKMATIVGGAYAKAILTCSDPRNFLFFPRTPEGKKAAADYFGRLEERSRHRDKKISIQAGVAQVKAIRHAGRSKPDDLSVITAPVFVANGDHDLMVDSAHSADMARRLPNAQLKIYPNSGHGGVFQHHEEFVPDALQFLAN